MKRYYFDSAASMPVFDEARRRVESQDAWGNPSSPHQEGLRARALMHRVRKRVSHYIGSDDPAQVYFTSGATEAANLLIQGYLGTLSEEKSARREIVVSSVEHPAVYQTAYAMERWGFIVRELSVNAKGYVEAGEIEAKVGPRTAMVCVMAVNNESGVIQPVNALAKAVKTMDPGIFFLCDAVQSFAKLNLDIDLGVVDALFMSGHKIGAEKGVGCFYLNRDLTIRSMFYGGEQEGRYRPGTENVRGIALFGEALEHNINTFEERIEHVRTLKRRALAGLSDAGVSFSHIGAPEHSSPYILSVGFPGIPSQLMLEELDALGFCLARGSACSSHRRSPSRVLRAMAVPDSVSSCSIRISFSGENSVDDVDSLIGSIVSVCEAGQPELVLEL